MNSLALNSWVRLQTTPSVFVYGLPCSAGGETENLQSAAGCHEALHSNASPETAMLYFQACWEHSRRGAFGWKWWRYVCESHVHWTTLSGGVSFVGVEMMCTLDTEFSSGRFSKKRWQASRPDKVGRGEAAKLSFENLFFSCFLRFWNCWWWSEVPKSKQRPLLSTTTTVGGFSILKSILARTRPLNTFRTCVSKSSKASFSTMKRQDMNKRTKELAPWRQHFSKGSCCFPLQSKISSQAAVMAIENAVVAMAIHTLTYSTNPIFVKTLHKVRRLVHGRLGVVYAGGVFLLCETLNMACVAMCCHVATKTDSVSSKWPRAAPPRRLHRMAFGRCFPGQLRNWTNLNKPFKHQARRSFG